MARPVARIFFLWRGGGGGVGVRERPKWTKLSKCIYWLPSELFIPGCIPCDSHVEDTPRSSKTDVLQGAKVQKAYETYNLEQNILTSKACECPRNQDEDTMWGFRGHVELPQENVKFRPPKCDFQCFGEAASTNQEDNDALFWHAFARQRLRLYVSTPHMVETHAEDSLANVTLHEKQPGVF